MNLTNYFDEIFTEDLMFESKELATVFADLDMDDNILVSVRLPTNKE
ncbi:MAG: hypothetical protein PHX40_03775 [Bacilli bacterium]|nr:hypothetical protein [Bacilli bacterium]